MNLTVCGVTERMASIQGFKQYFINLKKYNKNLSVCLCLLFYLPFYHLSVILSFYHYIISTSHFIIMWFYLSFCLSIILLFFPSIVLSFHLSVWLSTCLPACLSVVLLFHHSIYYAMSRSV